MAFEQVFDIFNWSLVKIDGRQTFDHDKALLFSYLVSRFLTNLNSFSTKLMHAIALSHK